MSPLSPVIEYSPTQTNCDRNCSDVIARSAFFDEAISKPHENWGLLRQKPACNDKTGSFFSWAGQLQRYGLTMLAIGVGILLFGAISPTPVQAASVQVVRTDSAALSSAPQLPSAPQFPSASLASARRGTGRTLELAAAKSACGKWYRVRRGDTLAKVARKCKVSVRKLKLWNRLRSNRLRVGRFIRTQAPPPKRQLPPGQDPRKRPLPTPASKSSKLTGA